MIAAKIVLVFCSKRRKKHYFFLNSWCNLTATQRNISEIKKSSSYFIWVDSIFFLFDLKHAINFPKNSKVLIPLTKYGRYSIRRLSNNFQATADVISILSKTPNTQAVFPVKLSKLKLKYAHWSHQPSHFANF